MIENSIDKAVASFIGAAYGDALGWPFERPQQSSYKLKEALHSIQELRQWTRKSGGRYFPYEENIHAGDYSDDTQLILCIARSLLSGENWRVRWSHVELPFWTLYERGGGGATKRAAGFWKNGKAPWESKEKESVKNYFEAGGNGVAMRALPHVLFHSSAEKFEVVAKNIFLDGIVTHGHPKALLGGLAYGYALWISFQRSSRVEYGQVISDLLENLDEWSRFPQEGIDQNWFLASKNVEYDYVTVWNDTVQELKKYFQLSKEELSKGALAIDGEVFSKLNCFDKKISGAGTVAAAAAIYLSSRYAAEPINGVVFAATADGADTDTIASMTGGLLGLMCGSSWLINFRDKIQDFKYLEKIAKQLVEKKVEFKENKILSISLDNWLSHLMLRHDKEEVDVPDNRVAIASKVSEKIGKSGKYKVELRKLDCSDGQSIFISKISKGDFKNSNKELLNDFPKDKSSLKNSSKETSHRVGIKLPVCSITESVKFYKDLLGFTVKKVSLDVATFNEGVTLVLKEDNVGFYSKKNYNSLIYIESEDIESFYRVLKKNNVKIITELAFWNKTSIEFFRCADLEDNIIEVFSKKSNAK